MKTIYKNTLFTLVMLLSIGAQAQNETRTVDISDNQQVVTVDRNIIWVHGLKGSQASWAHYDNVFEAERKINTVRGTHDTDHGLDDAANGATSWVNTTLAGGAHNSTNMAIGHSMGGLIIREMDRTTTGSNKQFGGFITVDTPNKGAYIANSILNGTAANAISSTCNSLLAGPNASGWTGSLFNDISPSDYCDLMGASFPSSFITTATAQSIAEGSSDINTLASYNSSLPRIAIWGQENSPVHWRMVSSMIRENPNLTDNATLNNVLAAISQGNDSWFITVANVSKGIYNTMRIFYTVQGNFCSTWPMTWVPGCASAASSKYYKAAQWNKGKNWFTNSEALWTSVIGGTQTTTTTYTTLEWVPCPDDFYPPYIPQGVQGNEEAYQKRIDPYNDGPLPRNIDPCEDGEGEWVEVTHTTTTTVNHPTDGVVTKYTQKMTGVSASNTFEIPGANHFEVRDMSDSPQGDLTKQTFDAIFNRGVNNFFHTESR